MDGLIALIVVLAGILAFDVASAAGVDSRDPMPDDHKR
jgi:hypothetical protein